MSDNVKRGFLDTIAAAFLRRRLSSRRLRAAAVRGLNVISGEVDGGLRMDFDHAASCFTQAVPWLAAHASRIAEAPVPPPAPRRVPALSIVIMAVGSRGDVQPFIPIGRRLAQRRGRLALLRLYRRTRDAGALGPRELVRQGALLAG